MLSRNDIVQYILEGDIKIYPFQEKNLTGIGYNFSTTNFVFSVNQGILLTIYQKTTSQGIKHYVVIPANDTVLFFSKEFVAVSDCLAGTFHSKVARVCQGLGHISTTLDPTWQGQLIISVNNPTSKDIYFELDEEDGNIFTLLFYRFNSKVDGPNIHDNNRGRCDLLLKHFSQPIDNEKYQDKHLELKEFILNEFSNSLNGYDDFLNKTINDKFSLKIEKLKEMNERLEKDKILIEENRYMLGAQGKYKPIKNSDEKQLLESCILFELKKNYILSNYNGNQRSYKLNILEFNEEILSDAIIVIDEYIKIISYELENINHQRRITWQNNKTLEYAAQTSELVILRKKEKIKQLRHNLCLYVLGGLVVAAICISVLLYGTFPSEINDICISVCGFIECLLVKQIFAVLSSIKKK